MSWDKRWMRRSFDRAAASYDRFAELQHQVGLLLLAALPEHFPPGWLIDLGAGTGRCATALARRYPERPLLLVDISEGMLRQARSRLGQKPSLLVGDAEALPLAEASAGLIVANLVLQWCLDPTRALAEARRVLQPGGALLFSALVEGTLEELRRAWQQVDGYTHVNRFVAPGFFDEALSGVGFSRWRLERETIVRRYPSVPALLKEIKGIGAHNVTLGRPRHLLGKNALKQLIAAYPREEETIQASFVLVYGVAVG
ncbi:malonyl-ACP O-methyltransferase BioC [Methylothermus subterraneus]